MTLFRVVFLLILLLSFTVATTQAAPPPISLDEIEPVIGGSIVVERTEGRFGGDPDRWRMNMDIFISNTHPSDDLLLTDVFISYQGGSDPPDVVFNVATYYADTGRWIMPDIPEKNIIGNQIDAEETWRLVNVPEENVHPFPVPNSVTVELFFDGFSDPFSVTATLAEYVSPLSLGSYAFPGAAKDLPDGQYWTNDRSHTFSSHHRTYQRFAEDWGIRRWDGSTWTALKPSPSDPELNEDGLIWDKPIYAIADGQVVVCANGHPDNPRPGVIDPGVDSGDIPPGGNHLWIRNTEGPDERVLYAHFREDTIPEALCPDDPSLGEHDVPDGAFVSAGQYLGRVGNSGNSSGPHLHIHSQTDGEGVTPLLYHNIWSVQEDFFDPNYAWNVASNGAVSSHKKEPSRGVFVNPQPRANVAIMKTSTPTPAVAGTNIVSTIQVTNHGPDAASGVIASDILPPGFDYQSDTGNCIEGPSNILTCSVGGMSAQDGNGNPDTVTFEIDSNIAPDLVFNNGGPVITMNTVQVTNTVFDDSSQDNTYAEEITVIAEADLSIESFSIIAPPDVLIGEDAQGLATAMVTSKGPSSPMHATIAVNGTSGGANAIPDNLNVFVPALEANELRAVEIPFTVVCNEPGKHSIALLGNISPSSSDDIDPNGANNNAATPLIEVECVVPVALNNKPGSDPNSIHYDNGTIPAAVLTTDVGEYNLPIAFDASTIDPLSARFGEKDLVWTKTGGAPERHNRGHIEDAFELDETTKDGDLDMVLHFKATQSGLTESSTMGCIRGLFKDGTDTFSFFGCDDVRNR